MYKETIEFGGKTLIMKGKNRENVYGMLKIFKECGIEYSEVEQNG